MKSNLHNRARLLGTTVLAGVGLLLATAPAVAQEMETVTVTGYRASLASSTNAKRESVNFSDSVFAEDIGKFPDTNIAEAFNRIPGITISRENDGSGMRVAIRGLDTNHVKITLNGANVATASTGNTDANGANREVDLNIFPIELFSQLSVSKTSSADQLEGGASGVVAMRSIRPFDNPGMHLSYSAQLSDYENNGTPGHRGHLIGSYTNGPFGVLLGLSGQVNRIMVTGYEGAFNNLTVPSLSDKQFYSPAQIAAMEAAAGVAPGYYPLKNPSQPYNASTNPYAFTSWCNAPANVSTVTSPNTTSTASISQCNPIGGLNGWGIPTESLAISNTGVITRSGGTFPNTGVPNSYVGLPINQANLLALNPGLSIAQIGSAIIPRTGRPMFERGTRDRYNGILSFEYRPTDEMHFYFDSILGVIENNLDREDLMMIGRSGNAIPMNMTVDKNNVVTSADFANAQMALEARPYKEKSDYISLNPGMDWQVTDLLNVKAQINYSRAHFFRDSPTFMPSTPLSVVHMDNTGATPVYSMPTLPGAGLQDPNNYGWYSQSAVRLQQERRYVYTKGAHLDASYGGDKFKVSAGLAWDEWYRLVRGYDNGTWFAEAACGFNPSTFLPGPNTTSGCSNASSFSIPSAWTTNWGTGYSAGLGSVPTAQGPLVPSSAVPGYLSAGPNGFVKVNYNGLKAATNYDFFATHPANGAAENLQDPGRTGFSAGTNTNISSSIIHEKTWGIYGKIEGTLHRGEQKIRYNLGARFIRTQQAVTGYTSVVDARNAGATSASSDDLPDGARYPNYIVPATMTGSYSAFLPSANVVWEIYDDFQLRGAVSRTMTRPNPNSMLPQLGGGGSGADAYTLGNPQLKPFYSTNIDLGAELFTGGEGYLSLGVFKKMITGFPSNYTSVQKFPWLAQFGTVFANFANGSSQYTNLYNLANAGGCWNATGPQTLDCVNVNITQQRNATGLQTIKGMEFNWVQPFDFALEEYGLKGFGLVANVTAISTKTTPNSAAPSVVLNVSPLQYNGTVYYDNDGIMVKVSYAFTRGTITNSNVYGIISGIPAFTEERSMDYAQVDLSSSLKLSKIFGELPSDPELTFDVQNLFHALNGRSYKQYKNLMNYSYNGGSMFLIGIRGSL
ncbi:TonB-dependent receptor domain-containing protein [Rhizomicrobium electricum]|uniref:TonB-dependent receptor n=1 Tax=Rhizomicrobium electricum TaxID=480070 RepID=A0ABN1ETR6_9PROT|nr:TonB-dependent receptor [Rhizomicrobium electricum]NIJ49682.1 TonB-dependent receptor [Rhizomicrobium electricum]